MAVEFADRYNTALVCPRCMFLECHPRLWLRVDRTVKDLSQPGVFPSVEAAVSAARPGDTILIGAGGSHIASNIQIKKALCLNCKLNKLTEHISVLESKLQNAFSENAKLKVKQNKDEKLWKGLESKFSSTKALCDQISETLQLLAA